MSLTRLHLAATLLLLSTLAAQAATITGKVTDKTTNKPSPGDTVALIAFGQGMQVAATTKSDAQGRYTLQVPDPGMHLVRVTHQDATYFQPAPDGTKTVNVDIYDVAEQVRGISNEADVLSLQTGPTGELQVSEDFFVRNDSAPPKPSSAVTPTSFIYRRARNSRAPPPWAPAVCPSSPPQSPSPAPATMLSSSPFVRVSLVSRSRTPCPMTVQS